MCRDDAWRRWNRRPDGACGDSHTILLLSLAYLAIFYAGSLLGMMLLTMVVSLPFTRTGIWATRFNQLVSVVIACTCFGSGGMLAYEQLLLLGVV